MGGELIKDGDLVRIVIEGKYVDNGYAEVYGEQPPGSEWLSTDGDKVTVEKIEAG